ncbi:MAG: acyl-CoA thioesterase [Anaerolineales bacterium]|nr:acyl-CoA thioesterase [Anaerolineales bacterium]
MNDTPARSDAARHVGESRVTLSMLMGPTEANLNGNVHGGYIMRLMDEAGASAAMRHARRQVVTVAVDQVLFREPIHLGDLVTFTAELTYVGRTSMETRIEVLAQNLFTSATTHTNTAYFVYVALDPNGKPAPVPPLELTTPEEQAQWEAAKARQAYRLAQRRTPASRA